MDDLEVRQKQMRERISLEVLAARRITRQEYVAKRTIQRRNARQRQSKLLEARSKVIYKRAMWVYQYWNTRPYPVVKDRREFEAFIKALAFMQLDIRIKPKKIRKVKLSLPDGLKLAA